MCNKYLCEESINFLLIVLALYEKELQEDPVPDPRLLLGGAGDIVNNYIRPGSPFEINVSSSTIKRIMEALERLEIEYAMCLPRAPSKKLSVMTKIMNGSGSLGTVASPSRSSITQSSRSSGTTTTLNPEVEAAIAAATAAAANTQEEGTANPCKFSSIFRESYHEVFKMLSQNIMPKLEASEAYQEAMASYVMRHEQEDEGEQ